MNFSPRPSTETLPPAIQIILASQSIGRKTLLEKLGLRFRVVVTHVKEDEIIDRDPVRMLRRRATAKADEILVHPGVYNLSVTAPTLVIAADSEAIVGSKAFGKAQSREDAKLILRALMGRTHAFTTAVTIILLEQFKEKKRWEKVVKTRVTLRKLSQPELETYINRFDFTRFAAGYALTETPWDLVTKIDGSYTNVVGLPFEVLLPILRNLKILV